MDSVTIGDVEVRPLLDTGLLMNLDYFFPEHAAQARAEYPDLLDERQLMRVAVTCYLVRSGNSTILVDTGLGNRRRPQFPIGHLDETLQKAGVAPESIDTIVHTHLHIDHVGWNTVDDETGNPRIFFPNARYLVQQVEWDHWMKPETVEAQDHLRQCVRPIEATGRVNLYNGETSIDANLTLVPAPGHTPGHVTVGIYSQGERAIIIGDASHHPLQLDHPDWSPSADIDPKQSATTRQTLMESAADDGRTWIAGHWPHPGIGRIVRLEGKRVFQAL
jgi:glyoxylase-like metal-dependent hydrolase (beta-lactamase superfamily II)